MTTDTYSRFSRSTGSRPAGPDDVDACYRNYLGREPDHEGRQNWVHEVQNGMTLDRMRSHMIGSAEFHGRSMEDQVASLAGLGTGDPCLFDLNDIETVRAALHVEGFRGRILTGAFALPEGFDTGLDPSGDAYRDQQLSLWAAITGRSIYDPLVNEDTPEVARLDPIYRPAFYSTGDTGIAGDHLVALGHLLKRSGLKAGARALEYGAGFGQIALAFSRLGVKVDTVDVNPHFSAAVSRLAEHYRTDLRSHVAQFGFNPAGEAEAYDLIYFYESFHHCFEFKTVIPQLVAMLKPGGKVMMAGEPVVEADIPLLPYDWGIRLDGENVAIMRERGWMELGFNERYLESVFADAGLGVTKYPLPGFHYATVYAFERPL